MTDDYTPTRESGSGTCNRRSRAFNRNSMDNDYNTLDDAKFRKKYGIDKSVYTSLRARGRLEHFLQGHDTCPRVQYVSKIAPAGSDLATAWNESKSKYAPTRGLYSGDLECVVCKAPVTDTTYCKETACMYKKCWKHLAADNGVRILNAHTLLGDYTFSTVPNEQMEPKNGVFFSPDNEIIVPALYSWSLKVHLKIMKIMDTPACYNVPLLKQYLSNVFHTGISPNDFITVLYNSNKKIFHNVPEALGGGNGNIIQTLVNMRAAFAGLNDNVAKNMNYQLLFYILFKCALTLDSTKSMYLYSTFVDTVVAQPGGVSIAKSSDTVTAYIKRNEYTFKGSVPQVIFETGFFMVTNKFDAGDKGTLIKSSRLEDEFEAVDIDLVNVDRIPYVYFLNQDNYIDCRTKRVLANYILPGDSDLTIDFSGPTVSVSPSVIRSQHGHIILSPDAPDWYSVATNQPVILLQRTFRTFYTDKRRGSVSKLIMDRLKKNDLRKGATGSADRGAISRKFSSITTDRGQWRYNTRD